MLGRSDGTLNPSGVRFGSAEIYNIGKNLILHFHMIIQFSFLRQMESLGHCTLNV